MAFPFHVSQSMAAYHRALIAWRTTIPSIDRCFWVSWSSRALLQAARLRLWLRCGTECMMSNLHAPGLSNRMRIGRLAVGRAGFFDHHGTCRGLAQPLPALNFWARVHCIWILGMLGAGAGPLLVLQTKKEHQLWWLMLVIGWQSATWVPIAILQCGRCDYCRQCGNYFFFLAAGMGSGEKPPRSDRRLYHIQCTHETYMWQVQLSYASLGCGAILSHIQHHVRLCRR